MKIEEKDKTTWGKSFLKMDMVLNLNEYLHYVFFLHLNNPDVLLLGDFFLYLL